MGRAALRLHGRASGFNVVARNVEGESRPGLGGAATVATRGGAGCPFTAGRAEVAGYPPAPELRPAPRRNPTGRLATRAGSASGHVGNHNMPARPRAAGPASENRCGRQRFPLALERGSVGRWISQRLNPGLSSASRAAGQPRWKPQRGSPPSRRRRPAAYLRTPPKCAPGAHLDFPLGAGDAPRLARPHTPGRPAGPKRWGAARSARQLARGGLCAFAGG
jgi:hypothetical protein